MFVIYFYLWSWWTCSEARKKIKNLKNLAIRCENVSLVNVLYYVLYAIVIRCLFFMQLNNTYCVTLAYRTLIRPSVILIFYYYYTLPSKMKYLFSVSDFVNTFPSKNVTYSPVRLIYVFFFVMHFLGLCDLYSGPTYCPENTVIKNLKYLIPLY